MKSELEVLIKLEKNHSEQLKTVFNMINKLDEFTKAQNESLLKMDNAIRLLIERADLVDALIKLGCDAKVNPS